MTQIFEFKNLIQLLRQTKITEEQEEALYYLDRELAKIPAAQPILDKAMAFWNIKSEQFGLPIQKAKEIIVHFEGLAKLRPDGLIEAYRDSGGIPTIGYGKTKNVSMGMLITKQEAEKFLMEDINEKFKAIQQLIKVQVNDNQLAALISFVFNIGEGAFGKSTLLRKLNSSDYSGAAAEFKRWVKDARGNSLKGLVRRRKAEELMFNSKNWKEYKNYE